MIVSSVQLQTLFHYGAQSLSCVPLFATSRTVAHQAPLSIEFPRQEYWSGLPLLTPGVLPHPGIEPVSPTSLALAGAVRVAEYSFLCYTFSSVQSLSGVQLFATLWAVAHQAPLSIEFPRQEYYFLLLQGIFLTQGSNFLCLLHWQADSLPPSHLGSPIFCILG